LNNYTVQFSWHHSIQQLPFTNLLQAKKYVFTLAVI
jgi:hypothetical protein